jgi:glutathione S-transferase
LIENEAMTDEIVFYTNPRTRGRTTRWMLEEIGEPYRTELLEIDGSMKSPEYLAINPLGKVPTIVHRGVVVTESAAICAYLADAFPAKGLAPEPGSPDRGTYYRWLFFAAGPLEAAVVNESLRVEVKPEQRRMVGYGSLDAVLDALEREIGRREFVSGSVFGAADLYLSSLLGWSMLFGIVGKRPAFESYCARFRQRPAFLRAQELDGSLA